MKRYGQFVEEMDLTLTHPLKEVPLFSAAGGPLGFP